MFNYEKAKEMLDLSKKLGPEYEALVKWNINSVYGAIYDNASMHKQEMKTDGLPYMESQEIMYDLENDIKCYMRNVYGIKNPKVTVNDNKEVTINVHDGDYYITNVIFNDPATIVFWSDGTKTVVKCCEDDEFDEEKGLAMAVCKKVSGNDSKKFHRGLRQWIKPAPEPAPELEAYLGLSKLFTNFGKIVNSAINDAITHNRLREQTSSKEEKNMPNREYREVDFHKYCPKCKYWDIEDIMNPCNECLGEPCNKYSEKPIYYRPDEEVKL